MIVIDAGALIEALLGSPAGAMVRTALRADDAAAPALLDAEVFHHLLRLQKRGYLTATQVDQRIQRLLAAAVVRVDHRDLLAPARAYGTALSGYDALYVALAAALDATLLTTDQRLASTATQQFGVAVTTVPVSKRGL